MSGLDYSGAKTGRQFGQQGSLRVGEKTSMQRGDDINREMSDNRRERNVYRRMIRESNRRLRRDGDLQAGEHQLDLMGRMQARFGGGGIPNHAGDREMAATQLRDRHRLIQQQDAATDGTEETEGTEERDAGQYKTGAFRQPDRDTSGAAQPSIRPGSQQSTSLRPASGRSQPTDGRPPATNPGGRRLWDENPDLREGIIDLFTKPKPGFNPNYHYSPKEQAEMDQKILDGHYEKTGERLTQGSDGNLYDVNGNIYDVDSPRNEGGGRPPAAGRGASRPTEDLRRGDPGWDQRGSPPLPSGNPNRAIPLPIGNAPGGELSALDRELLDHGNEVIANRGSRAMPLRGRISSRLEARAEGTRTFEDRQMPVGSHGGRVVPDGQGGMVLTGMPVGQSGSSRIGSAARSRLDDQFPEAFGGFSTPEARIAADNYRREGFPSLVDEPIAPLADPAAPQSPPRQRDLRGIGDAYSGRARPPRAALPENIRSIGGRAVEPQEEPAARRAALPENIRSIGGGEADAPTEFDSFRSDRGRAFQEGVVGAAGRFAEGASETAGMIGRGILGHRERVLAGIKDRQMASYERGIQEIEARKRREVPASRLDRLTPWGVPMKR